MSRTGRDLVMRMRGALGLPLSLRCVGRKSRAGDRFRTKGSVERVAPFHLVQCCYIQEVRLRYTNRNNSLCRISADVGKGL